MEIKCPHWMLKWLYLVFIALSTAQPGTVKSVGVVINSPEDAIALLPVVESIRSDFSPDVRVFIIYCFEIENGVERTLRWYGLRSDLTIVFRRHVTKAQYLSSAISSFSYEFENLMPLDAIVVHGQSSLVAAATIAASANKISVIHLDSGQIIREDEDGLSNSAVVRSLASLQITPTDSARRNLLRRGISNDRIKLTGSPVVASMMKASNEEPLEEEFQPTFPHIVLFFHFSGADYPPPMFTEVNKAVLSFKGEMQFIYVFFNANKTEELFHKLPARENVIAMFDLNYKSVLRLLRGAVAALSVDGSFIVEAAYVGTRFLAIRYVHNILRLAVVTFFLMKLT